MDAVTDPAILAQLNGTDLKPVSDPAILAQLNGSGAPQANTVKPPWYAGVMPDIPRSIGETAMSLGSSVVAKPVADVAGLAAMLKEILSPTPGGGDPQGFREHVQQALTYEPRTGMAQNIVGGLGQAGKFANEAVVAPLGKSMRGDSAADSPRGMAANAAGEATMQGLGLLGIKGAAKAGPAIRAPGFINDVTGRGLPEARTAAMDAARANLSDASQGFGKEQAARMGESHTLEDVAKRLDSDLAAGAQRNGRPTLDVQGESARSAFTNAMSVAEQARKKVADPAYEHARAAAAAKEAGGARVDVSDATKEIANMRDLAENIPELKAKLTSIINSAEGVKPPGASTPAILDHTGKPMAPTMPEGLTYEQLSLAARRARDIAYGADMEGYGSVVRRAAQDFSKKLDTALANFVPEHRAAANIYREMSKPMDALGTRYGRAISETEGGLGGDVYTKVAAQDIPGRLFKNKEGINLLVDALSGGKDATPAVRAANQARVDTMVEHYIMEGARGGDAARVGSDALRSTVTPPATATLNAVPSVKARVADQLTGEAGKQTAAAEARTGATAARSASESAATSKASVDSAIAKADADLAAGSHDAAYKGYVSAMRQSMAGDPDRYRAALALIERADTLQARTDKARRIARMLATAAGLGVAGKAGFNLYAGGHP